MRIVYWLRVRGKTILARHFLIHEFCKRCGANVGQIWTADDYLWEQVTGRKDGGGIFCIRCFDHMATLVTLLRWIPVNCDQVPWRNRDGDRTDKIKARYSGH